MAAIGDSEPLGLFGGVGQRKGAAPPTPDKDKDSLGDPLGAVKAAAAPHPVYPQLRVPNALISTRPGTGRPFEEVKPFCASANDLINPIPPSLFYGSGWFSYHPPMGTGQSEILHYWYSTLPTSKLRIPIMVGAGDIGVYYLKEPIGTGEGGEGSAIECWVDDNYGGAVVIENGANVPSSTPAYAHLLCRILAQTNSFEIQVGNHRPYGFTRISFRRMCAVGRGGTGCSSLQNYWNICYITFILLLCKLSTSSYNWIIRVYISVWIWYIVRMTAFPCRFQYIIVDLKWTLGYTDPTY